VTDAARALIVALLALTVGLIRLAIIVTKTDPASAPRLVAELRLAQFAALLLVLNASIYIGFALAQENINGSGLDVALGFSFLVLASVTVTRDPKLALTLLAASFAGHAIVDLLHSTGALPTAAMPHWYATLCAIHDVTTAAVCYLPVARRP